MKKLLFVFAVIGFACSCQTQTSEKTNAAEEAVVETPEVEAPEAMVEDTTAVAMPDSAAVEAEEPAMEEEAAE